MSAPPVLETNNGIGTQLPSAMTLTGDLVIWTTVRGPAVGGGYNCVFVIDPPSGGTDFTNFLWIDGSGLNMKAGSGGGVVLGDDASTRETWISYCFIRRGSDSEIWAYAATADTFDPAAPSFLVTPSRGAGSVPAGAGRIYTFCDDDGSSGRFDGHAGNRGFATANLAAWTQAAVVEQFCHRWPIQYPVSSFSGYTDAANGGSDLTGNGNNDTWTQGSAVDATSPVEPVLWTVTDEIRIGSMVVRNTSTSTADHTVSA